MWDWEEARSVSVQERYALQSCYLEALAATHVLAGHHVVSPHHVGPSFGKAGAIALVGSAGKLLFLGADQPADFVLRRLMAVRTIQRVCFFVRSLVEKFPFVHRTAFSFSVLWIIAYSKRPISP